MTNRQESDFRVLRGSYLPICLICSNERMTSSICNLSSGLLVQQSAKREKYFEFASFSGGLLLFWT